MSSDIVIHDPLTINLQRQTRLLLSKLPNGSPYATSLLNVSSYGDIFTTLSHLLTVPALTLCVATLFRPILLNLCALWLQNEDTTEEQLVALCLLLEPHEELFPILSALLSRPKFEHGPLSFLVASESIAAIDAYRLHKLLLAYYRILRANRELPYMLTWPLSLLSQLIWTPHPDTGVRLLSIRCYALHSGMGEAEREKLEKEVLGELAGIDCPLHYGEDIDGTQKEVDGWIMPIFELKRVTDARNSLLLDSQDYYTIEEGELSRPIHPSELSPLISDIHGIFLLRSQGLSPPSTPLISTPTTIQTLRALAVNLSLRLPTLLTSPPSSGKSLLLSHLAAQLFPDTKNQIINIHLADTSLDPRSLLGSYVSSQTQPGTFEWKEGVLVRAMREGKWIVFDDIDRGSSEVLGVIKPLAESLGLDKWIGGRASIEVPSRGRVRAHERFSMFATRSLTPSKIGTFPNASFFGAHKFHEVVIPSPTPDELRTIVDSHFPRLRGCAADALVRLWDAVRNLESSVSTRDVGMRELEKFCVRVQNVLPSSYQSPDIDPSATFVSIFPNPSLREEILLEARDVFFGAGTLTASDRTHVEAVASTIAEHLGLDMERREWVLNGRAPEFDVEKDVNGSVVSLRIGRTRLGARSTKVEIAPPIMRPFAMHKPALLLLSRIATAVAVGEPVLLTGETGTGKTSIVTHLASLLRQPLVSLNLSHQTESSDLLGGFKPIDAKVPGSVLQGQFLELFGGTFSRRKNAKFEESVRTAVSEGKWKRAVGLWRESIRLAKERIQSKLQEPLDDRTSDVNVHTPRKRRKMDSTTLNTSEENWMGFERSIDEFEIQHVQGKGKFAFGFMEGPLVKALRSGDWVLLDEINLASPETLACISGILHGPTASITLTEQGSLEPVPRHPGFRLFACMNPATDVGKKDLPPNIRSHFTEIDVPPPDADRETLLGIVSQYLGPVAVGDKAAMLNVAEFYSAVRELAQKRQIADRSNHRPYYSMRTLARALTFAADMASTFGLRRAIWEGCLMAFTMVLDIQSAEIVTALAYKHLLSGVRNPRSLLSKEPPVPHSRVPEEFVKIGPFYVEKGPLPEEPVDDYILTPSVETKLVDLARIMATKRFPVLIEGPTSSGKTSSVEYLARRSGHRFVRINNHEHTDIQEYLGSYVSDPLNGKLVFKDGLLIRALRNGDWIVLDELNLAPTDVLEALNRLLDDNRELMIPETQEVVRPHPHFMLFATQNPPGLYAGRKVLSRAFRSRFIELHFEDVPQAELETILCQRCRIAPSYAQRIVSVFRELQKRRQSSRVFESKHGFATLRDLFRWAGRDAVGYQELANNGYMLLAERARRDDDKNVVKDVLESIMKVHIDEESLYDLSSSSNDFSTFLGCRIPSSRDLVWTAGTKRLFVLLTRAFRFNEPVLLVGETGSGKTSICQVYADAASKRLHALNCHQNTETADLIGGLRPVRNRAATEAETLREAVTLLHQAGVSPTKMTFESVMSSLHEALKQLQQLSGQSHSLLTDARRKMLQLKAIFQWHDGPLVNAMRAGDVFLLDEISLADDSVLERLNSVLESGRTIVLVERGGDDSELPALQAVPPFKLVATMNPGGDYGKKELSPALRNRFTEIWVPAVDNRVDLELIVGSLWNHDCLQQYTSLILDFVEWLCIKIGDKSVINLRDILAWVAFTNATYHPQREEGMSLNEIFHHAAHMTFLDGLGSLPQLTAHSPEALQGLRVDALSKLHEIAPVSVNDGILTDVPTHDFAFSQLGSFSVSGGSLQPVSQMFNFQAPTTQDNAMRVVRACQLPKPILLEGSPGVGKTSLISALANISGHHLFRINLSDQTDLADLFGSDLPLEGGGPGEFAWKDAEFLKAMQEGHWVLLDEMNLAPQAVLEGLNAALDHRGTVYIPELGRSFVRHPSFRVFAAQNPLSQGGGRKGLPKSFVNRFTKVYIDELSPIDLLQICQHLFPEIDTNILRHMIAYNSRLIEEIRSNRTFARQGSPWEFNLRDLTRWGTLLGASARHKHPAEHLRSTYLHRFRTATDQDFARTMFDATLSMPISILDDNRTPQPLIASTYLQFGHFHMHRNNSSPAFRPSRILQAQLPALETMGQCVSHAWLVILTGPHGSGKTGLIRAFADSTGNPLREVSISCATDTMDLLGSFEQVDNQGRMFSLVGTILSFVEQHFRSVKGSKVMRSEAYLALRNAYRSTLTSISPSHIGQLAFRFVDELGDLEPHQAMELGPLQIQIQDSLNLADTQGRFEWIDGPLVQAIKMGHWIVLDGANLCNPSVLDRLNSLCEENGVLTLSERGYVNGEVQVIKPHPNFRLFMTVDPYYGELSRAMRNRGVEIATVAPPALEDQRRLLDHLRLPIIISTTSSYSSLLSARFDMTRRGICRLPHQSSSTCANWPSGRPIDDSTLSTVVDYAQIFAPLKALSSVTFHRASMDALLYFLARTMAPAYFPYINRFLTGVAATFGTTSNSHVRCTLKLLHAICSQQMLRTLGGLRHDHAQSRGVPSEFMLTQPMDFYLSCLPCTDCSLNLKEPSFHLALFEICNLQVATIIDQKDADTFDTADATKRLGASFEKASEGSQRASKEVSLVLGAISSAAKTMAENLDSGNMVGKYMDVKLILRLLDYARILRRAVADVFFDYSVVQVVSKWIMDSLESCSPTFTAIASYTDAVQSAISLSSGLGIAEIWSTLVPHKPKAVDLSGLTGLEDQVCNLGGGHVVRRNTFQLMALQALPNTLTDEDNANLSTLTRQVEGIFITIGEKPTERDDDDETSLLIAELKALSIVDGMEGSFSKRTIRLIQEIIESACLSPSGRLLRLVPYQHVLWAVTAGKPTPSLVAQSILQWLKAIWTFPRIDAIPSGPSFLFQPSRLCLTVSRCDWSRYSLSALMKYQESLHRHLRLELLHCYEDVPRTQQLAGVLLRCILMLSVPFASSYDAAIFGQMRLLSGDTTLGSSSTIGQVLRLLEQTKHPHFSIVIDRYLRPALNGLLFCSQSGRCNTTNLGLCWIAFSKLIVELYVPNVPVDPAAMQFCRIELLRQEEAVLLAQHQLHLQFESHTSGNKTSIILRYIDARLKEISSNLLKLSTPLVHERPQDASRLHAYWSEVSQFLDQVLSFEKIDSMLIELHSRNPSATLREQVCQESITGFARRLDAAYPEFEDISFPLQLALQCVKLGLRLAAQSIPSDADIDAVANPVTALVAFPSVRSRDMLCNEFPTGGLSGMTAFNYLLLKLAAISFEQSLCANKSANGVDTAYEQALRLWLIDRARDDEEDQGSQLWYRRKPLDYDPAGEAEEEEREFLSLFPTFEDVLDQAPQAPKADRQHFVMSSLAQQLVDIHNSLHGQETKIDASALFLSIRRKSLESLLPSLLSTLPDTLDVESHLFQIFLLQDRLSSLADTVEQRDLSYNFYNDTNISETKKAATIVEALAIQLESLIREWPDQMVLQHLKSRCDLMLHLDLHSPVAKVLSGLEQLLMQTEDWEIYANRENSLKLHQQAMTGLIVEWRRLELSCWQGLLASQAKSFANGVAEWWFRLYDAAIRGPLDAFIQDPGDEDNVTTYLTNLVPLLDAFICSSPLGQYHSRMQLLRSFVTYVDRLTANYVGGRRMTLERVRRVLHVTSQYYDSFSARLSNLLSQQQSPLENDLRAFIKLASWKDVNVHALKQSARKTHHQLYKIIRKFRDLLRQPISDQLRPEPAGQAECNYLQPSVLRDSASQTAWDINFPVCDPVTPTSRHLFNLNATFKKFDGLVNGRIRSFIKSCTAGIVDHLAVDIISTARTLANAPVASSDSIEKREKRQKALLVRKRKAWSDLLKELKRGGLAVNVKPEVLKQQREPRWIREQPVFPSVSQDCFSVGKIESYFIRLIGSLPELRASLPHHHPDLTTRELERGTMFVESCFAIAVEARACLAIALEHHQQLEHILRRLTKLTASSTIIVSDMESVHRVSLITDTLCKLKNALDESSRVAESLNNLRITTGAFTHIREGLRSIVLLTESLQNDTLMVVEELKLAPLPVFLQDEHDCVCRAHRHLIQTSKSLAEWCAADPSLGQVFQPVRTWLEGQDIHSLTLRRVEQPPLNGPPNDIIINTLLVNVQILLSKCPTSTTEYPSTAQDQYLRDGTRTLRDITRLLNLGDVVDRLVVHLNDLSSQSDLTMQDNFRRFTPFLSRFVELSFDQLTVHSEWLKALLKLGLVLSSVTHTLAKQGFCKPPDAEDSGEDGDVLEAVGGVGLGEGSGNEDVSKEIHDESQVEGMREDEAKGMEPNQDTGDDNAIEMSGDIGGDSQHVPEAGSDDENESNQDSDTEIDEEIGKLDASDPSAIDEKIWGDEPSHSDPDSSDKKTDQDHSKKAGEPDVVGKEDQRSRPKLGSKEEEVPAHDSATMEDSMNSEDEVQQEDDTLEGAADSGGAPMDDYVQDANTLDLPDDMDLGLGEQMSEEIDAHEDEDIVDDGPADNVDGMDDGQQEVESSPEKSEQMGNEEEHSVDQAEEDTIESDNRGDNAVPQPDVSAGELDSSSNEVDKPNVGEGSSTGQQGSYSGVADQESFVKENMSTHDGSSDTNQSQLERQPRESEAPGAASTGSQQGLTPSQPEPHSFTNPLRSVGDMVQEIKHRFDNILSAQEQEVRHAQPSDITDSSQVEHVLPDDIDQSMQALGPAGEEQLAKLNDLKLLERDTQWTDSTVPMDVDLHSVAEPPQPPANKSTLVHEPTSSTFQDNVEGAVTDTETRTRDALTSTPRALDEVLHTTDMQMEDVEEQAVESELKLWLTEGLPSGDGEHIWRMYESLTHDLAYALCEQLRLILEPTLATRLKGDYRTGKRLNMKKIISYIASDYTKDKIWLRRTRPSQREYQVLIALDDSKSMAESHSIHLAYETLALVSKALGRLEVGDIAIAKFGEGVDILHGFDQGPFTDQAGTKVVNAFRFNQKATNVLSLVETSLRVLENARERRSMTSATSADLWQLEIIISDGMCQDHDCLRTVLRKAEEQRVMIVFIVIDSLQSGISATSTPSTSNIGSTQNSVLSMNQVSYKNVNGRLEMQVDRYLDSFPFEYFVVLRNVEALPEVLSGTLKQFFERISEE